MPYSAGHATRCLDDARVRAASRAEFEIFAARHYHSRIDGRIARAANAMRFATPAMFAMLLDGDASLDREGYSTWDEMTMIRQKDDDIAFSIARDASIVTARRAV